ncbi:MAG: hypothetical protein KAQ98_13935 [Bacteriovoracaceae bacterium]|nr:hypothetical protein [Bacteriovoracaceae bacterium]
MGNLTWNVDDKTIIKLEKKLLKLFSVSCNEKTIVKYSSLMKKVNFELLDGRNGKITNIGKMFAPAYELTIDGEIYSTKSYIGIWCTDI